VKLWIVKKLPFISVDINAVAILLDLDVEVKDVNV
jgi:hypothetical protein